MHSKFCDINLRGKKRLPRAIELVSVCSIARHEIALLLINKYKAWLSLVWHVAVHNTTHTRKSFARVGNI